MIILRDYQQRAVGDVREKYRTGAKRVILVKPTGAGKTVTFCYLAAESSRRGKRVLIQAHRIELVEQISAALSNFDIPHGLIVPGQRPTSDLVHVAMKDTLAPRIKHDTSGLYRYDLVITDECHHLAPGSGWDTICQHNADAYHLGVTATPCRLDGKPLGKEHGGFYEDIVIGPTVVELIEQGYLCPPIYYRPSPENMPTIKGKVRGGDYTQKDMDEFMDSIGSTVYGNSVNEYTEKCPGAPSIGFCVNIKHAEQFAEQFRESGYQAAVLTGKTPKNERAEMIRDLGEGRLNLIASVNTISEGTDIPNVIAAFMLRPTASLALNIQMCGRPIRTAPGKNRAFIFDQVGNSYKHGFITDHYDWSLTAKPKKVRESGDAERDLSRQCPKCWAVDPRPVSDKCINPDCDHVFEVEETEQRNLDQIDAPLTEIDPMAAAIEQHYRLVDKSQDEHKARKLAGVGNKRINDMDYEELRAYAKEKGYKPQWAWVQMQQRKKRKAA